MESPFIRENNISAALSGLENIADFQKRHTPNKIKAKKNGATEKKSCKMRVPPRLMVWKAMK